MKTVLRGKLFQFETTSGLFSKDKVDLGSQLLIENMDVGESDLVLDLGCGYGPIGLVAASLANNGKVYMVDTDIRAVKYSKVNSSINKIANVEILASDGFEEIQNVVFDLILSNPPSHLAKEVMIKFVQDSKSQLKKSGRLYLVTEKRISPMIKRELEKEFGNCKIVARDTNYSVSMAYKL